MPIYTVGHSNHTPDQLFSLLALFGITHIIDIRSVPYSGRFPYFNKDTLKSLCEDRNIVYEWRGESLGGLRSGESPFDETAFQSAIKKLAAELSNDGDGVTACLICAERDPSKCHRSKLVGPALRKIGVDLHHILVDGTLKLQSELEEEMKAPKSDRSDTMSLFDD